ncbi:MAG: ribosome maturation factor RimP [Candidatus Omnitrophota bacterium]
MENLELLKQIEEIIAPILEKESAELVDMILRRDFKGGLFLRLLVDKPYGGISVDECVSLNNQISNLLDTTDLIQSRFILEISSPGADRPLIANKDFKRAIEREVRLFLSEPLDGKMEFVGKIIQVWDDCLVLEIKTGPKSVPFEIIAKGKQII